MAIEKNNGDMISFLKQKDYIMVNNDLGGGSFGKTVVLKDPYIGELFVAKKYEPEFEEIREVFYKNFLDEIRILHKLNHSNIVRIFSYYPYEEAYTGYILMEFINGVDIGTYIRNYKRGDGATLRHPSPNEIFSQLIEAFCCIEKHHIIHRDIREGNIMIDSEGVVKVIDFGIGKIFDPAHKEDSLVSDINRADSDTLPQEYYSREYTSLTDMFYIAELLNRLMATAAHPDEMNFEYQEILDKMMCKDPKDRYQNFSEIKENMGKHDFLNIDISESDKRTYQDFSNLLHQSIKKYTSEPKFISDPDLLIDKIKKVLLANSFEDYIQKNNDVINCVVMCNYVYSKTVAIPCKVVKDFLGWLIAATRASQELVLTNLVAKLSTIQYEEPEDELPF